MQIKDILSSTGGLESIARELGISESEAADGAAALAPAILGGLKKQTLGQPSGPGGLDGLGSLLGQLGGGGLLDDVLSSQPTDVSRGNDVLGQIFGSKDVSRAVAQNAASQSGLDAGLLKKMLPMVTMLIAGYMAKQAGRSSASPAEGGLGGLLGGLPGGSSGGRAPGAAASGGLASFLDLNGDGNALDDIIRMAGKQLG